MLDDSQLEHFNGFDRRETGPVQSSVPVIKNCIRKYLVLWLRKSWGWKLEKSTTTPKVHFAKKRPVTEFKILSHEPLTAKDDGVEKTESKNCSFDQFTLKFLVCLDRLQQLWRHLFLTTATTKPFWIFYLSDACLWLLLHSIGARSTWVL